MIDNHKSFKCPHCDKEFLYKEWDGVEKHIKNCPNQYKSVKERFKKGIKNKKLDISPD